MVTQYFKLNVYALFSHMSKSFTKFLENLHLNDVLYAGMK